MRQALCRILVILGVLATSTTVWAEVPLAGSNIGSQAAILYTDASGVERVVQTNMVTLIVQSVFSANLRSDNTLKGNPGQIVVSDFTLTNAGNAADLYCILGVQTTGDAGDFNQITVVADQDANGRIDDSDTILWKSGEAQAGSLKLEAFEHKQLLMSTTLPLTAVVAEQYKALLQVKAQQGTGACVTGGVTDSGANANTQADDNEVIVTVSNVNELKPTLTASYLAGGAGVADDQIEYTMRIDNNSTATVTNISLALDLVAGESFVAGSGLAVSGLVTNIAGPVGNTMTFTIDNLAAEAVFEYKFRVDLINSLPAGTGFSKFVTLSWLNELATTSTALSNNLITLVPKTAALSMTDTNDGGVIGVNDGKDDDGALDGKQTVKNAPLSQLMAFDFIITNTGNATDAFNISFLNNGSMSALTPQWQFFRSAGAIPLQDSDGDGVVETPALDPSDSLRLRGVLSLNTALTPATSVIGQFQAMSRLSAAILGTVDPRIDGFDSGGVDIAFSTSAAGLNDAGVANAQASFTEALTLPPDGTAVERILTIVNEGQVFDSFTLTAPTAPADYLVSFPDGLSVRLAPGATGSLKILVKATSPNAAAVASFALSVTGAKGQSDSISLSFTLASAAQLEMLLNQVALGAPCGTHIYEHSVSNQGNSPVNVVFSTLSQSAFTGALLVPTQVISGVPANDRLFSSLLTTDKGIVYNTATSSWSERPMVTKSGGGVALPLNPKEKTLVRYRVAIPCGAAIGARDTLVLKAAIDGQAVSVQNTNITTVANAVVSIVKEGALDAACDGAEDVAFRTTGFGAQPNQCILWRLSVQNRGSQSVCNVAVNDVTTTAFVAADGTPVIVQDPAWPVSSASCNSVSGQLSCSLGPSRDIGSGNQPSCMAPGEIALIKFKTRVN